MSETQLKLKRTIAFDPSRSVWTLNGEFSTEELEDFNLGIKNQWLDKMGVIHS